MALVQPEAIYLANTDGSGERKVLSFAHVYTMDELDFFPVVVPLPDGSGFRVVIPAQNSSNQPTELSKLWEIPISGEAVMIHSFDQRGFPFFQLSPDGRAIGYTYADASDVSHTCIYRQGVAQDACPTDPKDIAGFVNWSTDSTKFVIYSPLASAPAGVAFSIEAANAAPVQADASAVMQWVDANRYLYVGEDHNLSLVSLDGTQSKLDKGISPENSRSWWGWQFDFSR